jgi:hypothetical protein
MNARTTHPTARPTARTTRAALGAMLTGSLLAATLAGCSFSASASTTRSYPGTKLAGNVEKQLVASNPGIAVTGTACDDTPKIAVGRTTSCHATVNGEATPLVVTWKSTDGDYEVTSVAA